jgi:chromosome partitioning protein
MAEVRALKVTAIANQKGGVGKTSTCVNLCAGLGLMGKKVLLVDMDPQSNSTSGLGVERHSLEGSIYDMLVDEVELEKCVVHTQWKGVSVLPSTIDLAGAEIELVSVLSRESRLKKSLESANGFDHIFIDCPPSLGLLTLNSLVASNSIIIPIQCEYYALEGLSQLTRTIDLVKSHLNSELYLEGLLMTMFDMRTRLSKDVADEVRARFGEKVFKTSIPRNVRISEAPSHGMPIQYYDPASQGSTAYNKFAKEVVKRWQNKED